MMQHQYWITKKSVQRKLGSKEDECIVSSDAELDAKLELFRSISESSMQLQRIIDLYQERLCCLAQEENTLGRYLKECGKNEKNTSASKIMTDAGKALAYTGHQRLAVRPPLVRLHHEVETFRGRAVADTRTTVLEMEKIRTEYRAALSWMKSVSTQLDPDTGCGLERFRKAQSYVKSSKMRFDRILLACLQKVDLLAAARCNMFSHALISYQNAISMFSTKAADTLSHAGAKLNDVEPFEFCVLSELASPQDKEDKDKSTFFNSEFIDDGQTKSEDKRDEKPIQDLNDELLLPDFLEVENLLGDDFSHKKEEEPSLNVELLALDTCSNSSLLLSCMPSRLIQEGDFNSTLQATPTKNSVHESKEVKNIPKKVAITETSKAQVSWLSLFKELDPLANQDDDSKCTSNDRA